MMFRDNAAGQVDSRGTVMDSTREVGFMQDTTLSQFFERPVKILETNWALSTPLFVRFNPWKLFWENPRNLEKINNYYLLKCTMHVKLLINGNAFYYGRAMMGYEPLAPLDNTSAAIVARPNAYTNEDLVRLSQRMHIFVNPTECTGGSLELPFFWNRNALRIPLNEWDQMGECVLMSINDLQHANGGTDPLTISVLAWAENVSYAIPTASRPTPPIRFSRPEMADEHEQAVVSRPASTVARYAGALTNIPWIGPFAKATEIGASAVAAVAKIFGYSSPPNLDYGIMVPTPRTSLAVVDTKYPTNKLSVDSKQEITIDPSTTGINSVDELPIASIANRESYLTSFDWAITDAPDSPLFSIRVDPVQRRLKGREYHFPACAAATIPFDYWRGTMRYRFQIVSSAYHKGRIRIVYDPYGGSADPEFNTHYTTVHDISNEKDFTVDVGWAQHEPFRKPLDPSIVGYSDGTTPFSGYDDRGNGVLSVYVLNSLTVPGTVVANVQVNVFVSALDDFEVAMPNSDICNWRFRDPVPPPARTRPFNRPEMAQEGMEDDMDCCDNPVNDPPTIDTMADVLIETPDTTKLFFGEVIGSFRQLLKRTELSEVKRIPDDTTSTYYSVERRAFPEYGGLYLGNTFSSGMPLQYSNGQLVVPCATTHINYVGRMFLGWRGSIRWTFDTATMNVQGGTDRFNSVTVTTSRKNTTFRTFASGPLVAPTEPDVNLGPNLTDLGDSETTFGAHLLNTNVNPIQSIEVPFYSNKRFLLTQNETAFDQLVEEPCYRISTILPGSSNNSDVSVLKMYCSAGEDFNLFFFNGLPPVYYATELPSDPGGP